MEMRQVVFAMRCLAQNVLRETEDNFEEVCSRAMSMKGGVGTGDKDVTDVFQLDGVKLTIVQRRSNLSVRESAGRGTRMMGENGHRARREEGKRRWQG